MSAAVLEVRGLEKNFGGVKATDAVDLDVIEGELHALIGPNGAGKTTLISQLCGLLSPDGGSIHFNGQNITGASMHTLVHKGLSRSFQITSIFPEMTALENTAVAVQAISGHSFRFWRNAATLTRQRERAFAMLERVALGDRAQVPAHELSHGERRQLEIAMALCSEPRLLLLDEPMAGMGGQESAHMLELLQELKGDMTILLVEHDMDAVFSLADRVSVLVYGRVIASGDTETIRNHPEVRAAYLGDGEDA